jgi:NAD(P)-dependent dehydrogenase (short-subunit alcohol dehydrogenase family)
MNYDQHGRKLMYDLDGRVALITGGAGGIGRAIALRLADEGCDVGILDLDAGGTEETALQVRARGRRAATAFASVAERAEVDQAVAVLADALGPVDILINNAGILRVGRLLEIGPEDWQASFRVNADGPFNCCQAVVPAMVRRGRGRVINLASWLGKVGMRQYGAYCASKFAVVALTQTLALEVAAAGVTVNAICPGTITETAMRDEAEAIHRRLGLPSAEQRVANIPLGRLGLPDDIARVAAFLASDEAGYMTGQAINVTGGLWLH